MKKDKGMAVHMSQRIASYALVAATAAGVISALIFERASSSYATLRAQADFVSLEEITKASHTANVWFIVVLVAVSAAIIILGQLIALKRKGKCEVRR